MVYDETVLKRNDNLLEKFFPAWNTPTRLFSRSSHNKIIGMSGRQLQSASYITYHSFLLLFPDGKEHE